MLGFDTATPATVRRAATRRRDYAAGARRARPRRASRAHYAAAAAGERAAGAGGSGLGRPVRGSPWAWGRARSPGLRIGVATARGLAQSLGVEVVGVCSSAGPRRRPPCGESGTESRRGVLAAIDARRGEAFAAAYDAEGELTQPARASRREELAAIPACARQGIASGWRWGTGRYAFGDIWRRSR